LHCAVVRDDGATCQALLDLGADETVVSDVRQRILMHWYALQCNMLTRLILDCCSLALVDHVLQTGYSPISLADTRASPFVVSVIRRAIRWRKTAGPMLRFRRAHEAHRDARLVFRAAAEGRPLELQRRLVLGKLAGGATITGETRGATVPPIEAAQVGGHDDCVKVLTDACRVCSAAQHNALQH